MSTSAPERPRPALAIADRFVVAWQHPVSRRISPVGFLTRSESGYAFAYLERAAAVEGFQPFLGFPSLDRCYESDTLFDLFAQRVMRSSRRDYAPFVRTLGLDADAARWAVLGRSQGRREGDGIRVFPEPVVTPAGETGSTFFASGLRHRMAADPAVGAALAALNVGDRLDLRDGRSNPEDARALLVAQRGGVALAWILSLLLDWVHTLRDHGPVDVRVAGLNGPDVPAGYRLLVIFQGYVPAGYRPFGGPEWATAVG